jgi:hypothetical protein
MKSRHLLLALACTLGLTTLLFPAQQPVADSDEPLVDQVRKAIDKGVIYLRNNQHPNDGTWDEYVPTAGFKGGTTAMAVLAFLNAGVPRDDPVIVKGLNYLRSFEDSPTYVRALQTMALVEAGYVADSGLIKRNVDQFRKQLVTTKDGKFLGWNYGRGGIGGSPDNSNTQYALLALWVVAQSDLRDETKMDPAFWDMVRDYYGRTQNKDGGWGYAVDGDGGAFGKGSTLTMTAAGLGGLVMAQMERNAADPNRDPVAICGKYEDDVPLRRGLAYVAKNFNIELPARTYYNLYGIERLGRLSGLRFLGEYDWYREGCVYLVKRQAKDGHWAAPGPEGYDHMKVVSTSFALLFLSKGRTPILISKLAHGNLPRHANDQDWNRRRNDLRHLVAFASKNVFKKMPLGWQNFDMLRASLLKESQINELTSELLQSPILYIIGHDDPNARIKESEKAILKKYVENGGFILAVACCGSPEFDKGFRQLCRDVFEKDLAPLDLDHAVWNMRFEVPPGSFKLEGLQIGCKTAVIYSPENICGYWELNRKDDGAIGSRAFHLGANIIAYATGLEAPKPRLTHIPIAIEKKDDLPAKARGFFKIAQITGSQTAVEKAKWTPAPEAMHQLASNLREVVGLDVLLKTDTVYIDNPSVTKYKFLYMHGRHEFRFKADELDLLRKNLLNGGLLFADACCGKEAFDKGFRQFIEDLFPKDAAGNAPRLEPIPFDDDLFSKDLNGEALTESNILLRKERGQAQKATKPLLEGVKVNGRWAVIYSQYDIGCALERHQSADCRGYNYESAVRLARAAVLYQFRP